MADLLIKKIQVGTQAYSIYDERVKVAEVPAGAKFTDTTYTGTQGITVSGTNIKHSNAVTAVDTQGLLKISYDAYGHITGSTAVTKADITGLGIPDSDTTYGAEKGISLSGGKFGHSNTAITAATSAVFKKIKYDAYGHITGVANVESSDITPLISGATADITELQTLVNKIKAELEDPSSDGLTSVLETMQNILNSSSNAVTGITYSKQTLSVDANGVLSISDGSVTPTTAAFVTANTTVTPVPAGTND